MTDDSNSSNSNDRDVRMNVDLGGLLGGGLGKLLDLAKQLGSEDAETMASRLRDLENGVVREGSFTTKSGAEGVFGVRIRSGIGGERKVETFGNIRDDGGEPTVSPTREPMTDVIVGDDAVRIVAEMPGAVEDTIQVVVSGRHVTLEASGAPGRRYEKVLELEVDIDEAEQSLHYRNGILEVVLPRRASAEPADETSGGDAPAGEGSADGS